MIPPLTKAAKIVSLEDVRVEIGIEAECFDADLAVMPPARRPSAAAWVSPLA